MFWVDFDVPATPLYMYISFGLRCMTRLVLYSVILGSICNSYAHFWCYLQVHRYPSSKFGSPCSLALSNTEHTEEHTAWGRQKEQRVKGHGGIDEGSTLSLGLLKSLVV